MGKLLTKQKKTATLKKPYIVWGFPAYAMLKFGLAQWKSANRVRLGTKQH